MKKITFLLMSIILITCDDPSLENQEVESSPIEPIQELTQLSSIDIATNNSNNITRSIHFNYEINDLISSFTDTQPDTQLVSFDYSIANRLEQLTITNDLGNMNNVTISNEVNNTTYEDFILLSYIDTSGNRIEKEFYTDQQNRINEVLLTSTDLTGTSSFLQHFVFTYTQNFNVSRISELNETGITIAFTDFSYNFNNNPFKDMNDLIRIEFFNEFNPYSRNLPATREDFTVTNTGVIQQRSINYTYNLGTDGFPMSRELQVSENGNVTTYFEFFNYRP